MRWALWGFLLLSACEARLAVGSSCTRDSECPAELVCDMARCREECLEQRDCRLGARCLVGPISGVGRCSLPDDPDCRVAGNECEAGLLCVGRACVNACETTASCPSGSICVPDERGRAYCERADLDASFPDASYPDAPFPDASYPDAPFPDAPSDDDAGVVPTDAPPDAATDGGACVGSTCEPVAVAVVPSASCALFESGEVWCWGAAGLVARDDAFPTCVSGPCAAAPVLARMEVGGSTVDLTGAARLAGGRNFGAIVGGRLVSWGSVFPTSGTMGDGEIARPVRVAPSGSGFLPATAEEVTEGYSAAFARLTDGTLHAWGDEDFGQWGRGVGTGSAWATAVTSLPSRPMPRLGGWHGCTIGGTPARVSCWGENDVGQAGGATFGPGSVVSTPTVVAGVPDGASVVVPGRSQTCALVSGVVHCWGAPYAIGTAGEPPGCHTDGGSRGCPPTPVTWDGGAFTALYGGPYAEDTCAVDGSGRLFCWGAVTGDEPTLFDLPTPVTAVALGDLHSCAIAAGEIWCWGANVFGQLGRGASTASTNEPPAHVVFP